LITRRYPLRKAKIQDFQAIVFRDVEVARFEVTMNDSLRVRCIQAVGQLRSKPEDFSFGKGSARKLVVEGDAGD
jgi:hypothetical protein